MKKIFLSTLIVLFLFSAAFAQETQTGRKLVFINKLKFEDERSGVEKLVAALRSLKNLGFNSEFADARDKAEFQMKSRRLVEPVRKEISTFLKQVETENNLLIMDSAELDNRGQLVALSNALDVSSEIISAINVYFKTQKMPLLTIIAPKANIAAINTKMLFDEKAGLNKIKEKAALTRAMLKKQTGRDATIEEIKQYFLKENSQNNVITEIFEHLEPFAAQKGFNIVLDPSNRLPVELRDFPIDDVTKDFISYYNQLNP